MLLPRDSACGVHTVGDSVCGVHIVGDSECGVHTIYRRHHVLCSLSNKPRAVCVYTL